MPQTLYNLDYKELEFDPLSVARATAVRTEDSASYDLAMKITELDHEFTNEEIGRIMAGFFLIAQKLGESIPGDLRPIELMRYALAALDTTIIWERG